MKLLDQGKREEAFEALARAAEIREKLRTKAPDVAQSKRKSSPAKLKKRTAGPVEVAHIELDLALKAGNVQAARKASARLRSAMATQSKRLAALEKQLSSMERQMAEIRKLLRPEKAR